MNRFLLCERSFTTSKGEAASEPLLVNLDHVRNVRPDPYERAVIRWTTPGAGPTTLTDTFATVLAVVRHATTWQEGPDADRDG